MFQEARYWDAVRVDPRHGLEDSMDQAGDPGRERDRKPKDHSMEREDGTMSNLVYFSDDLLTEP